MLSIHTLSISSPPSQFSTPATTEEKTLIEDIANELSQPDVAGKKQTNILKPHLLALQKLSETANCIIGIRPVDPMASLLIARGYPSKNLHIKGKSASWGPQAGLICTDQKYSKLENLRNTNPDIIEKFNEEIEKCVEQGYAKKVDLICDKRHLDELLDNQAIKSIQKIRQTFIVEATSPSGSTYQFEISPTGCNSKYIVRHNNHTLQVLAPLHTFKPFTADYDLLLLGPLLDNLNSSDNLSITTNSYFGDTCPRIAQLIPVINKALTGTGEPLVHHGADSSNPHPEPKDNYPATLFLPKMIGDFSEICIIHTTQEMHEFIQSAKDAQYHIPINSKWESEITQVRRHSFVLAQESLKPHYSDAGRRHTLDSL